MRSFEPRLAGAAEQGGHRQAEVGGTHIRENAPDHRSGHRAARCTFAGAGQAMKSRHPFSGHFADKPLKAGG